MMPLYFVVLRMSEFQGVFGTQLSLSRKNIFEKGAWELPKTVCHELALLAWAAVSCSVLRITSRALEISFERGLPNIH